MEGKNAQKLTSESNIFQIPIEKYDKDMDTEYAKDKKKEIIDLFINNNYLRSEDEFETIESNLHEACKEGNLELIKIYLSETIENDVKDLKFKIDKTNKTASLFRVNNRIGHLTIPRTVKHDSTEYLITSITGTRKDIKSISFVGDSSVKIFYRFALSYSNVEEIYFPKSLTELKEGWCHQTTNLKKIVVSPLNKKFAFKEGKYLIGKSDENNDEYDIFLYARRDIYEISIPSNIKTIESYAFENSDIRKIFIPAGLTELKEGWCNSAVRLRKIVVSPSNKKFIFKEDKYLVGKSDENNDEYDVFLFADRETKKISIPSNIKTISSYAFECSEIKEIFIPPNVSRICKYAFSDCKNLRKVKISTDSILQTIESNTFSYSEIEEIFIPSNVSKICESAFTYCMNLRKVEIPINSNLKTIESYAFYYSGVKDITIPPKVSKIYESAFESCRKLQILEISEETELTSDFPFSAFYKCRRLIIMIPSSLGKLICLNKHLNK